MNIKILGFGLALLPGLSVAQTSPALLVNPGWLAEHLHDKNLVILDIASKAEYTAGHIPGARSIGLDDVSLPMDHGNSKALMLELPPPDELRARLAACGISDDSRIVVSYGKDGPFQSATRIVFTLDYLGLGNQTSVLNGGAAAWAAAGKTLVTALPVITPGKLTARPVKAVVADAELVKTIGQHSNYKLVDARAPVFYQGSEASFGKLGHIPGAVNIPFTQVTNNTLSVDVQHLADIFRDAGVRQGDTVVAYCHVGQQATAVVFAARVLGFPVMLYDGSFQDWVINSRGPRASRADQTMTRSGALYSNPYLAGTGIGVVILTAWTTVGRGVGASGAFASIAASATAAMEGTARASASPALAPYLPHGIPSPLQDWLVLEMAGVASGAFLSAWAAGRLRIAVERGRGLTVSARMITAVAGGTLMGLGAKLARGCTSGQALTGGALLSVGSWIFILTCFASAYALSPFARRLWR